MPEALYWLGRLLAQQGREEEARERLRQFLETNPPAPFAQDAEALLQALGGD